MTLRDLSEGLRDLAEDVQSVDLHARAVRTSRRLRARRAAGVMSGALALVLIIVVGVSLSWHRTEPGTHMDSADGAVAEDSASDAISDDASSYAEDGLPGETVRARVGYYLRETSPSVYAVLSWDQGDDPRLEISGDIEFAGTVAISPSGRYAAYYETGRLAVADIGIDSTDHAEIVYEAQGKGDHCATPTWAPDSSAVVLSEAGAKASTLVDFTGEFPAVSDIPRPKGCSPQMFTYGMDVATYGFASVEDENVLWTEADDGTTLASASYDTTGLGFTVSSLASVSADGTIACLAGEPDAIPPRVACTALTTPKGLVYGPLPMGGTLTGASFLDNGIPPSDPDGLDEGATVDALTSQDMMLRVRAGDSTYVAQTAIMAETVGSGDWGDVTVTALEPVQDAVLEPPSLADAYLLMYTG